MITRRDFLASGLVAAGTGLIVPPILAKGVFAAAADGNRNDRVLVVLQLGGGNDGLNTVIPYADPAYLQARPTIGITPDKLLPLNGNIGLHSALKNVKALYDKGQVAIVQGVGYDNPTYSHFEGLHVWENADPKRQMEDGWLGRFLAAQLDSAAHPLAACSLGQVSTPGEMRASKATVSVIQSADSYQVQGGAGHVTAANALYHSTPGLYGALFDQALQTADQGIAAVQDSAQQYQPAADYGTTKAVYGSKDSLAAALQLTAQMIITQPGVKICHVALGGFDTHQAEDTRHAPLLQDVDTAVGAFMTDLAAHGQAGRVALFTWSEFGRRVAENGSKGTDHGAAAPMFVIGAPVKGGLYGEYPSLTQTIDSGNLKYTVDFRSIYQTLIRDWMQGDPGAVLGGSFPEVPLITTV